MGQLRFDLTIHAPREAVWDALLGPATYRIWTAAFAEGSFYEGSWATGERIRFLSPGGKGLTSVIAENRPFEFLSIQHLGLIENGIEDTESDAVRSWAPAFENYTLVAEVRATRITVELEVPPDFEDFMQKTWPKALANLKALCEPHGLAEAPG